MSKLVNDKYVESELNKIIEKINKGILILYKVEIVEYEKIDN